MRGPGSVPEPGDVTRPSSDLRWDGTHVRLGIISDTHGTVPAAVFHAFEKVDQILHAGDIGNPDVLTELEAVAPVIAVHGNTDGPQLRASCPRMVQCELDGFIVVVTHGDQFGTPTPDVLHQAFPDGEIIVYGHTHEPVLELVDRTVTVMNPGTAGAPRYDARATVGIMELEAGIPPRARIMEL